MKLHKILIVLIALACLAFATGCKGFSQNGFPVIATMDMQSDDGFPVVGRTDGNTYLLRADANVTLRIVDKASGLPIVLYEVSAGKVALISKKRDFKETFNVGDPLPAWVLELFPDGGRTMAEALGFVIEAEGGTPPMVSP